jgi:hypothetical protein
MSVLRIPVKRNIFDYEIEPEGLNAVFRFNYNARIDSWILDIVGQVEGIRIVGGIDILERYKYKDIPQGELRILDLDGTNLEPTKDNFGDRVILLYTEP